MESSAPALPRIETERLILSFLDKDQAGLALDYFSRNREHLGETMPCLPTDFFELEYWENRVEMNQLEFSQGKSCRFFLMPKGKPKTVGTVNFTEVIRGVYQGCFLGYGIDQTYEGQGFMSEALRAAIDFSFKELNIHKLVANYMPTNKASARVLEKLGFYEVGVVKQELYLNGGWQDHIETRLINPRWNNTLGD